MHDILSLDKRGIPGTAVASEEFVAAANAQSKALGFMPAIVWLEHPIQNRTEEELREIAHNAIEEIIANIVEPN